MDMNCDMDSFDRSIINTIPVTCVYSSLFNQSHSKMATLYNAAIPHSLIFDPSNGA